MPSPFDIVELNDEFIIINKHDSINFHDEGDLGQGLFSQVKKLMNFNELFPVHRLDKLTSGLVIFARTLRSAQQFQQLFNEHKVEKFYIALSDQKPKKKQGLIKGDMAKSRRGMWKLLRSQESPATTQFFSYSVSPGIRGFLIKPHSGKTHQIRVALASIGAPILGDNLYSKTTSDRGYLHAFALNFTLNNQTYQFNVQPTQGKLFLNENCQQWLAKIQHPWQEAWPTI